jgi:nuclear pore complex protein Nup50
MSQKRIAGSELNHDNWNDEEENEDAGEFKKATTDILEKRIRKIAKRRMPNKTSETEALNNPFIGFGGFQKESSAALSPFGFLSKIPSQSATLKVNGEQKPMKTTVSSKNKEKNLEYFNKVKGLNKAFVEWIKSNIEENDLCDFTPVFRDYEKYMKKFEDLKENNLNASINLAPETTHMSKFSFEKPKTSPVGFFSAPNTTSSNVSVFFDKSEPVQKSPSTQEIEKNQKFSFGSANQTTPIQPTSKLPLSTPFSFGLSTNAHFSGFGAATSTPFSFNNVGQTAISTTENVNNGEDEADEEPPKNEFVPVVEEDSLYSKRCKVFVKTANEYADRGVGTLYIKKVDEKIQLLVRADTNLGNIIFNIIITAGLPVSRQGKNNVMIVCVPTPDSKPIPTPVLIRVKTSEEADELKKKIEKYIDN